MFAVLHVLVGLLRHLVGGPLTSASEADDGASGSRSRPLSRCSYSTDIHVAIASSHIPLNYVPTDTPFVIRKNHTTLPIMSRAQDAAIQMAETIQTASIVDSPSVEHDMNPSTAASEKEPVRLDRRLSEDMMSDIEEDEVPISLLRPMPRKPQMPPLPDLRFEQSYLSSIKDAKDWKVVTYITLRDQVCFPA